jgi:hypothetical protein
VNPTRPSMQHLATGVIKTVAGDAKNGERTQKPIRLLDCGAPAMRISRAHLGAKIAAVNANLIFIPTICNIAR